MKKEPANGNDRYPATWLDHHHQTEALRLAAMPRDPDIQHDDEAEGGDDSDGMLRYERVPLRAHHRADGSGVEYQRPIFGGSLKGSFKLPHNAIRALGNGDPEAGLAVSDHLFGHHTALGRGTVHPLVVAHIGEGDLKAGHKVLRKFVSSLKQRSMESP